MYKVMIVDDEILVRIGIRTILDWNARGFKIVAEAGNGEAAYEKYLALRPEVIITDIKMPKKDGFWLTDKIKADNPKAEIIFLTCYDDFEYARTALYKKVSSYVLKAEMEEDELGSIMDAIKLRLDSMRTKEEESKQQEDSSRKEDYLLALVLDTRKPIDVIKVEFEKNQIDWEIQKFCFVQFDFKASLKDHEYAMEKSVSIITACKEIILNKFSNAHVICLGKQFGKSITCLLIGVKITEMQVNKELSYIKDSIKQYFNVNVKSASSDIVDSIENIRNEVNWIYESADLLFYVEPGGHLTKDRVSEKGEENARLAMQDIAKEMCTYIEEGMQAKLDNLMEHVKKVMQMEKSSSFDTKFMIAQLITEILKRFEGYSETIQQNLTIQQDIMNADDIEELMTIVKDFAIEMISLISGLKLDNSDFLIEKAIHYIEENYKDKLTLEDVAGYVGISKYYFSYLFKKVKDINFSAYINILRMEKAKELLKQPQMTINQVYSEVGFNDQQYFSKIFKKYVGMTVTEYRTK